MHSVHRCGVWSRSGGTPNLSKFTRAIPGVGYSLLPENSTRTHKLPYDSWKRMNPMGQYVCRHLVCDPGEVIPSNAWKPHWHNSGTKVGQNHAHVGDKVDNPFAVTAKI